MFVLIELLPTISAAADAPLMLKPDLPKLERLHW
jgi:hypothetical protein